MNKLNLSKKGGMELFYFEQINFEKDKSNPFDVYFRLQNLSFNSALKSY